MATTAPAAARPLFIFLKCIGRCLLRISWSLLELPTNRQRNRNGDLFYKSFASGGPRRGLDVPVVHPPIDVRGDDGPLALPTLHLRAREDVQPARVLAVRIRQGLLLDHRVVLVDRVL